MLVETHIGSGGWEEGTWSQKGLQCSKGRSFPEEKLASLRRSLPRDSCPDTSLSGASQELEHEKLAYFWEFLQLLDYQEEK